MRSKNGFTLVEMLAVVSIMLVLMTVTFGIFRLFAERTGPDSAVARIQAFINGARSHAAATGRDTRIKFRSRPESGGSEMLEGSTLVLQEYYYNTRDSQWDWRDVPGTLPHMLGTHVYVCKGLPDVGGIAPPAPADRLNPTINEITRWRQYEQEVLDKVADHAMSGTKLKPEHDMFFIEFCPAGFPPVRPRTTQAEGPMVQGGLTIVQVAGRTVTGHAFYAINTNTGTRLIFE